MHGYKCLQSKSINVNNFADIKLFNVIKKGQLKISLLLMKLSFQKIV